MPRARRQGCAAIVVALVMALISLSGCGSSTSSGTITLTEQDYYTTNPGSAAVNRVLDSYMKLHPNVRIKRTALPGTTYVTEVLEEATSSSLPDLLMLDNPYVPQLAQTNLLVPLERFGHFNPQSFIPSTYEAGVDYGKLYALPLYTNSIALFYNKKMLAAAHVSPPTTWAQLLQVAKRLTTPQHFGITFQGSASADGVTWDYEPFLWSNGGSLRSLGSTPAVQALSLLRDLVKEGAASPEVINYTQQMEEEQFAAGSAAMMINGPWNFPSLEQVKGLDYGVVKLPVRVPGQRLIVPIGGEFWTIPKTSSATERAAYGLLRYMFKSDVAMATGMGDVPSAKSALAPTLRRESPLMKPFVQEIEQGGRTRTKYTGAAYGTISNDIDPLLDNGISGQQTPSAALRASAKDVQQALSDDS